MSEKSVGAKWIVALFFALFLLFPEALLQRQMGLANNILCSANEGFPIRLANHVSSLPELNWTKGDSFPVVLGSTIYPALDPPPIPPPNQTRWYAGSVYPSNATTQNARTACVSMNVPASSPRSDEFYYVLLSAWDSNGSYDQIGFSDTYGSWGLAYSWTTGPSSNLTFHYSSKAMALSSGLTYTFNITVKSGLTHFVVFQGSTKIWSLEAPTGGDYLVLSNSHNAETYGYTDYEEVWKTSTFKGTTPEFDFIFSDNYWTSMNGNNSPTGWSTLVPAQNCSAPSNVTVVIRGNSVLVNNPCPPHFSDEFSSQTLDGRWAWNNRPQSYDLTSKTGWLSEVPTLGTDFWSGVDTGQFLYEWTNKSFTIETRVSATLTSNYQQEGLMVRQDSNNWAKTCFEYSDGLTVKTEINRNNVASVVKATTLPAGTTIVSLMMTGNGDSFTVYYSLDGSTWTQQCSWSQTLTDELMIGLSVTDANCRVTFQPAFDYFRCSDLNTYSYVVQDSGSMLRCSILSNSMVSSFIFDQPSKKIMFSVAGETGTEGLCNVTFPTQLIGGPYIVLVDGSQQSDTVTSNATHASIYFNYSHSTHNVEVIGTTAVPESPTIFSNMLVLAVLALILLFMESRARQSRHGSPPGTECREIPIPCNADRIASEKLPYMVS